MFNTCDEEAETFVVTGECVLHKNINNGLALSPIIIPKN